MVCADPIFVVGFVVGQLHYCYGPHYQNGSSTYRGPWSEFMVFLSEWFFVGGFSVVLLVLCIWPSAWMITERHRKLKIFIFELWFLRKQHQYFILMIFDTMNKKTLLSKSLYRSRAGRCLQYSTIDCEFSPNWGRFFHASGAMILKKFSNLNYATF